MAKIQISLRLDSDLLRKAQKLLRARTKTEAVERSLAAIVEMEMHRRLIRRFSGTGKPDAFRDS